MRRATHHNPDPRRTGRIMCVLVALLLALPLFGAAQTPEPVTTDGQALIEEKVATSEPTATQAPPTPTPTIPVPTPTPTSAPPTATQAMVTPTASPTATTTATSTPSHTATVTPLPNTDNLKPLAPTDGITLQPGEEHQLAFSYQVTTPRTGTSIHAELRNSDGSPATGWTLHAQTGTTGSHGDTAIDITDVSAITPGSAFTITFAVQAPADIKATQTVALFVSSTATTSAGTEAGIPGDVLIASFSVIQTSASDVQSAGAESYLSLAATAGQYSVSVVDANGNALQGACFTVDFETSLNLGLVGSLLDLLGLTSTVNGLVNELENRSPIDSCDSATTPTGVISDLVADLGALDLGLGLTLDLLLDAITITPTITPNVHPSGYANPVVSGDGPFTLSQFRNSGVESTISYTPLCVPSVSAGLLQFEPSTWNGIEYPETSGTLAITITATGASCAGLPAGWNVSVNPSALTGPGDTIDANDMSFTGSADDPPPTHLTPKPGFGLGGVALEPIATTNPSSTFPSGGITWNAEFSLDPDDDLPPGDYGGTIVIDINYGG